MGPVKLTLERSHKFIDITVMESSGYLIEIVHYSYIEKLTLQNSVPKFQYS